MIVGVADSGIDLTHPAFRNPDGTTRILALWDQGGIPDPSVGLEAPERYRQGVEWTKEQIDQVLLGEREDISLPQDTGSGHGTAVTGVAAGNGAGSAGYRYRGIAIESPILFVKLSTGGEGFSRTTELMEALDYMVRKAESFGMPVSLNVSYGNNNGAHDGGSLFEGYISQLAGVWKSVISVAAGNEGDARHHARVRLENEPRQIRFVIGAGGEKFQVCRCGSNIRMILRCF